MIFQLFRRSPRTDSVAILYGTIVAQAREPVFYQSYGVPDTVEGRFEMIVLHTILLLRRLRSEPEPARSVGQALFDHFCRDMDANLREMGVGDLGVPRKMKTIGEAFYGRKAVYEEALDGDGDELAAAIGRNVYGVASGVEASGMGASGIGTGRERLAAYIRAAVERLAGQDGVALSEARISFPEPESIAAPVTAPSARSGADQGGS
jgi:cytochrome b pre-mRNA-processing protein 3